VNYTAEQAIVALALHEPSTVLGAACVSEHFEDPTLAKIWRIIRGRVQAKEPCDAISVAKAADFPIEATLKLKDLALTVGLRAHDTTKYAEGVIDAHVVRRACAVAGSIKKSAKKLTGAALVSQALTELGAIEPPSPTTHQIADLCKEYHQRWERLEAHPEERDGLFVPTGIEELDRKLNGGLRTGHMHVIGAETNHGKSSLANAILLHAAQRRYPVDLYGFEDEALNVLCRLLSRVGEVDNAQAQRWEGPSVEVMHGLSKLAKLDIQITEKAPPTLDQLGWQMRQSARMRGTQLIVVDYLQRIRGCPGDGIYERMCAASGEMFEVAKDTGAAVLVCSQRNANDKNMNRSLKGAGDIGEDAYTVLILKRRRLFDVPPDTDERGYPMPIPAGELWVTKQKNGPTGECVLLRFDGRHSTFFEAPMSLIDRYRKGKPSD
jgi:replicative DNA helicase